MRLGGPRLGPAPATMSRDDVHQLQGFGPIPNPVGKIVCRSCGHTRIADARTLERAHRGHIMATGHTNIDVTAPTEDEEAAYLAGSLASGNTTLQDAIEADLLDDSEDD